MTHIWATFKDGMMRAVLGLEVKKP